jgi:signal transduction histidine kinase
MFDEQYPFSVYEENNAGHSIFKTIGLEEKELTLKQYRERLEDSERILQATNHLAKVVALEYDVPLKKLYWCKELYHLYEVNEDYIPGLRKDLVFYKERYRAALLEHINDAEQYDKPYDMEAELITAKGNHKWVRIIGESLKNKSDEVIKRRISIQDITDQKKRQLELQESSKIIADRNARLTNFAHIVSHNIRNHSRNISSLIELTKNEINEEIKQELFILLQNVSSSLNDTLHDLLKIVQVQTDTKTEKAQVSFEQAFDSVMKVLSADILKTESLIDADFSICRSVEYVPAYLESIMLNLISNAIKYRYPERQAVIKIRSSIENERPVLKISDNGLGIDLTHNAQKIFNLYQTFHNHPEAKGIGLYITKNQIESMDGKIEVESAAGEGTTFKITF